MTKRAIAILLFISAIATLIYGIITGNWKPCTVPLIYTALLLTPTYLSIYSNWYMVYICPISVLAFIKIIKTYDLYTDTYITELILEGIIYASIWCLIVGWYWTSSVKKDYKEDKRGLLVWREEYSSFKEYYKKVAAQQLRQSVRKGWQDLINNSPE